MDDANWTSQSSLPPPPPVEVLPLHQLLKFRKKARRIAREAGGLSGETRSSSSSSPATSDLYDGDDKLIQRIIGARMKASSSSSFSTSTASSRPLRIMKSVGLSAAPSCHEASTMTEPQAVHHRPLPLAEVAVQCSSTSEFMGKTWVQQWCPKESRLFYVREGTGERRWAVADMEEWMEVPDPWTDGVYYEHSLSGEIRLALYRTCWEERKDEETGETYYYNNVSKVFQKEPPSWIDALSPTSGGVVYVNPRTGERQRVRPDGFHVRSLGSTRPCDHDIEGGLQGREEVLVDEEAGGVHEEEEDEDLEVGILVDPISEAGGTLLVLAPFIPPTVKRNRLLWGMMMMVLVSLLVQYMSKMGPPPSLERKTPAAWVNLTPSALECPRHVTTAAIQPILSTLDSSDKTVAMWQSLPNGTGKEAMYGPLMVQEEEEEDEQEEEHEEVDQEEDPSSLSGAVSEESEVIGGRRYRRLLRKGRAHDDAAATLTGLIRQWKKGIQGRSFFNRVLRLASIRQADRVNGRAKASSTTTAMAPEMAIPTIIQW